MSICVFELARRAFIVGAALSLSACGGGSGGSTNLVSTPAPPASPPPSATPLPAPIRGTALVTPGQTAAPPAPIATSAGPNLRAPAPATTFPLLQTAVSIGRGGFSGDGNTTAQGATLGIDGTTGRRGLTLNNETLGVADVTATDRAVNGARIPGAPLPGGRDLQVRVETLDYTLFGYWLIASFPSPGTAEFVEGGTFLGGYVTPAGAIPASGTASYTGSVTGSYDESSQAPGDVALLLGNASLTADFAARSVSGQFTNLKLGSDWVTHSAINDVAFTASFDPAQNLFTGTTRVTTFPSGPSAFGADAGGVVVGQFFGPSANEAGGVWTLSDAAHRLIGSFGVRQ